MGSGSDEASGRTTLVVKTFAQFGYDKLYKQFEAAHPHVVITEENTAQRGDYIPKVREWMAAGAGAGDVVVLEEGILSRHMANPDQFVNLPG